MNAPAQGRRKVKKGTVVSNKMQKTVARRYEGIRCT